MAQDASFHPIAVILSWSFLFPVLIWKGLEEYLEVTWTSCHKKVPLLIFWYSYQFKARLRQLLGLPHHEMQLISRPWPGQSKLSLFIEEVNPDFEVLLSSPRPIQGISGSTLDLQKSLQICWDQGPLFLCRRRQVYSRIHTFIERGQRPQVFTRALFSGVVLPPGEQWQDFDMARHHWDTINANKLSSEQELLPKVHFSHFYNRFTFLWKVHIVKKWCSC